MKNILLSIVLAFVSTTLVWAGTKEQTVKIKTSAQCEECKERIERKLTLSKGIKEAILNLDDKTVTVRFNPKKIDELQIKELIRGIGYDADELTCDQKAHDNLPTCCQKGGHADGKGHGH